MITDWNIISRAVDHYTIRGYQYVDLPWLVDAKYSVLTAPPGTSNVQMTGFVNNPLLNHKFFVASSEQAFIEMMDQHKLIKDTYYQTVSPCIRDDVVDKTHYTQFMKCELFLYTDDEEHANYCLQTMIVNARMFFKQFVNDPRYISLDQVDDARSLVQTDIMVNGIEVGSYGIRKIGYVYVVYGTGAALPRLSIASSGLL